MRRFSSEELSAVRNAIPMRLVIENLSGLPHKEREGTFRFLCPICNEFQTGINQKTNLSRCFRCNRNFNTIELLMQSRSLSFVESVKLLLGQLRSAHPVMLTESKQEAPDAVGTLSNAEASCPERSFFSAASILERMMRS